MNVMVVGGSASGKSEVAEGIAMQLGPRKLYIATMRPGGAEAERRIARHRGLRSGKGFATVECCENLASLRIDWADVGDGAASGFRGGCRVVLLECLGNLVSNELYDDNGALREADSVFSCVMSGIVAVERQCDHLVVVANEVGSGDVALSDRMRSFVEMQGRVNNEIAACFDAVVEVVCGLPVFVKGGSTWAG